MTSSRERYLLGQAQFSVATCLGLWLLRQLGSWLGWWQGEDLRLWVTWGLSAMNSLGYLSVFAVFQLAGRLSVRQRLDWLLLALGAEVFIFLSRPYTWDFVTRLRAVGLGFGVVGLLAMILSGRKKSPEQERWKYLALVSSLMFLYPRVSDMALSLITRWTPVLYDPCAWRCDRLWWGFNTVAMAQSTRAWGLAPVLGTVYVALPLAVGLSLWGNFQQRQRSSFSFLAAYVLSTLLALVGYATLPMIGPLATQALTAGADLSQQLVLAEFSSNARNCAPSVHVTWALLVYRCGADRGGWARGFAALFAVLTALAIFPIGDHYGFDLLVALPFAHGVYCLTRWDIGKSRRSQAEALLSLLWAWGWLLGLRCFPETLLAWSGLNRLLQLLTLLLFAALSWRNRALDD